MTAANKRIPNRARSQSSPIHLRGPIYRYPAAPASRGGRLTIWAAVAAQICLSGLPPLAGRPDSLRSRATSLDGVTNGAAGTGAAADGLRTGEMDGVTPWPLVGASELMPELLVFP